MWSPKKPSHLGTHNSVWMSKTSWTLSIMCGCPKLYGRPIRETWRPRKIMGAQLARNVGLHLLFGRPKFRGRWWMCVDESGRQRSCWVRGHLCTPMSHKRGRPYHVSGRPILWRLLVANVRPRGPTINLHTWALRSWTCGRSKMGAPTFASPCPEPWTSPF